MTRALGWHKPTDRQLVRARFFAKTKAGDRAKGWNGSPCLEWQGSKNYGGYGMFRIDGATRLAHRVAWQFQHGPIADSLCIIHRCDNPCCVNTMHLALGTRLENIVDCMVKNRRAKQGGACNGNSKLTDGNVRFMRALQACGWKPNRIAAEFGIAKSHAREILSGKKWPHIMTEAA